MPLKTHHDEQPTLNLTPMIDVVFLLIIFFMVGAKFTEMDRQLDIEVPQVSEAAANRSSPTKMIVNVLRDGTITLDGMTLSLEQLTAHLSGARSLNPELAVVVRGDAQGTFQQVAATLSAVRQAGVAEMGIAVRIAHAGDANNMR